MTQLSAKQARKLDQQQAQGFTPRATATPSSEKVIAQHAVARTQADIAEMQQVGALRTSVVLQAFDRAMAQSDQDIIAGLEQRLGGKTPDFFGPGLTAQMQSLLSRSAIAVGK